MHWIGRSRVASYETYGRPNVHDALAVMFHTPAYFDFYGSISRKYKDFEFSDELSDTERLEEFAQIYQQFKKFVGSKTAVVMGMQENLDSLVAWYRDQLEKSDVYPKTRIEMVYNSLKVDWLRRSLNQVLNIIEELKAE